MGQGHIGLENNLPRAGSDQGGYQVAQVSDQGPPGFLPRPDASHRPGLIITLKTRADPEWYRPEGVADQVVCLRENGELGSVAEKAIRGLITAGACTYGIRRMGRDHRRHYGGRLLRMARTGLASKPTRGSGRAISS